MSLFDRLHESEIELTEGPVAAPAPKAIASALNTGIVSSIAERWKHLYTGDARKITMRVFNTMQPGGRKAHKAWDDFIEAFGRYANKLIMDEIHGEDVVGVVEAKFTHRDSVRAATSRGLEAGSDLETSIATLLGVIKSRDASDEDKQQAKASLEQVWRSAQNVMKFQERNIKKAGAL